MDRRIKGCAVALIGVAVSVTVLITTIEDTVAIKVRCARSTQLLEHKRNQDLKVGVVDLAITVQIRAVARDVPQAGIAVIAFDAAWIARAIADARARPHTARQTRLMVKGEPANMVGSALGIDLARILSWVSDELHS